MELVGQGPMDATGQALDSFFDEAFDCAAFLLMLYDEGRVPFSDRVPREAFVQFLIECIANANFIGTYESYIFLINAIFGANSGVFFEVTAAGVLTMTVSATNTVESGFQTRELIDDQYVTSDIITNLGEELVFTGFPGINSEAELKQLLSEFVPAGIFQDIAMVIFSTSLFLVEDGGEATIVDDQANDIIFFQLGG